ncbi:MAG: GNAT family N-acetyltransferase [Tannerella sp.]|jgi:diamine N-acetyltransferase|nr:GNAT family N-acetyltransferase [Tannerella sp.]
MRLLENDAVRLRALEPEDLDMLHTWENDTRLWQYGSTLTPYSRFALKSYLEEARLDIFQTKQLRLMIVRKPEGRAAGTIDLYDFDPANRRAGVGILVDEDDRRQGVASEALHLIRDYAFRFLGLKQLYAFVPERNEPSLKLFTRCGYRSTGRLTAWIKGETDFEDVFLMQLIAP